MSSQTVIQMYDPKREYQQHKEELDNSINTVLGHGLFINGPEIQALEADLSTFVGAECISVSNGTDALKIALLALDVGVDDEVITVAHSWISTAEVISIINARPVFIDIDETTFCMDPKKLQAAITPRTKAIIVVSLYGFIPDYKLLQEIAGDIPIIEDGAQSFGSLREGRRSCSCDHVKIATTSFFPSKPLGCYGDGGAIFTNDSDLALKIRAIKNHGGTKRFHHTYVGLNARLDTIQASILRAKFTWFEETLDKRNKVAQKYLNDLKYLEDLEGSEKDGQLIKLPHLPECMTSAWAQFSILASNTSERDVIVDHLKANGINAAIFYPVPLHTQHCFAYLGYKDGDLPVTERICKCIFNLPCYGELADDEQNHIISVVKSYFEPKK